MRKIFIDLGAHIGESVNFFRKHHPQSNEFEYHLFEPLPANIEKLKELEDVTVIPKAATTCTGISLLYIGMSESASLSNKKRTGGLNGKRSIKVETIDFIDWFVKNTRKEDYIIIKMNIEGAEYEIIEDMLFYGLLSEVDKWYVQFHWAKIGMKKRKHNRIKRMIPRRKLYPWKAMFGDAFVDEFKASL